MGSTPDDPTIYKSTCWDVAHIIAVLKTSVTSDGTLCWMRKRTGNWQSMTPSFVIVGISSIVYDWNVIICCCDIACYCWRRWPSYTFFVLSRGVAMYDGCVLKWVRLRYWCEGSSHLHETQILTVHVWESVQHTCLRCARSGQSLPMVT